MINLTKKPFNLTQEDGKYQKKNDAGRKDRSVVCTDRLFRRYGLSGACDAFASYRRNYVSVWRSKRDAGDTSVSAGTQ